LIQAFELVEWLKTTGSSLATESIVKPAVPQDIVQSDVISAFISKRKVGSLYIVTFPVPSVIPEDRFFFLSDFREGCEFAEGGSK
jgi:hypothetical protein